MLQNYLEDGAFQFRLELLRHYKLLGHETYLNGSAHHRKAENALRTFGDRFSQDFYDIGTPRFKRFDPVPRSGARDSRIQDQRKDKHSRYRQAATISKVFHATMLVEPQGFAKGRIRSRPSLKSASSGATFKAFS